MDVTSPISRQSVGRTFVVAICILGFLALVQLGAVCWIFISRYHATAEIETLEIPLTDGTAERATGRLVSKDSLSNSRDKGTALSGSLGRPTPIPQAHRDVSTEARLVELVQQARSLRERGDTSTALTRLREAQTISPRSALIISEVAITYEKMGMADKAFQQWRKIYDMGESAGIYYAAAKAKLNEGTEPGDANAGALDGIQPGMALGIGSIEKINQADENAVRRFLLRIPLKARPSADIDVRDTVIQVYFYDIVAGQDVVQTNANVRSHWSTLPADWSDDDIEVLEVEYLQPKPEAKPESEKAEEPVETRDYFGYVVRVYYRGELQDMRADPVKLLKQFPPPISLPAE